MKLRVIPHSDQLLVKVLPDPSHALDAGDAPGAIELPEAYRRFSRRGKVLAAGLGFETRKGRFVPTTVKPGDVVQLPLKGKGAAVYKIGGVEHRIVRERDCLGVIE
jgi:co-chaperonin GroES (HSP10)